jgi:hypothetical protein
VGFPTCPVAVDSNPRPADAWKGHANMSLERARLRDLVQHPTAPVKDRNLTIQRW